MLLLSLFSGRTPSSSSKWEHTRFIRLPSPVFLLTFCLPPESLHTLQIDYSEKYQDGKFEYRHVILPKETAKTSIPKNRTLSDAEWRSLGVQQSRGWEHYACHRPEPHILLFRRPLGTDPHTGAVDAELEREAKDQYQQQLLLNQRK